MTLAAADGKMDVAAQKVAALLQRRGIAVIMEMTVGDKKFYAVHRHQRVIRKDREFQHQLIHIGITVAPYAEQLLLHAVQHLRDSNGVVFLGQRVSGTVIQKVTQQNQLISLFALESVQQQAAVIGRSVEIGGN
jgi:hypothetical protein